jgi:acetyl-CoA carboxylase biotin carboxyl carrier protein
VLEHQDVEEILKLLDATPLHQFELETERFKITLRRDSAGDWTQEYQSRRGAGDAALATAAHEAAAVQKAAAAQKATPADSAAATSDASSLVPIDALEVRAPLIGTFYRSPKPGAPPFVEPGTPVGADTVVAIVETMKLMTSIYAGHAGRIAEILIDDGQFVEQDQLLMRVAADAP